jgi:hypothetical protein
LTVPAPIQGQVSLALMGSGSHGPLLLATGGEHFLGRGQTVFLDPRTLQPLDIQFTGHGFGLGPVCRVSGDGTVFTSYNPGSSPQGHTIWVLTGKSAKSYGLTGDVAGHITPGAEGRYVYTARGVFTAEGKPVGKLGSYSDGSRYCVPAAEGESFYLNLDIPGFPHGDRQNAGRLLMHLVGDDRPLAALSPVELPRGINTWDREPFGHDQRLHFVPSAKLLVVFPDTNDRLELYRVDTEELLAKSDRDYLVVTSRPPTETAKSTTLRYAPVVKSKKGGVKLKLEAGPEGMRVTADGRLTWAVPRDFAEAEVDVILTVSDASGQEVFHTFKIAIK